ncbi:hypothetical protein A3194_19145 [Candidatus Thiodiazotropha endoloripes]|uniref:hypothetical protein n=1 Tax=Candidatus Thiodiazotropha endoloripes TaxID=1818881 RepID=UPI00083CAC36|nr:hypothetical protein [Candidatus Thiodiazotropha endoloripes]ODB82373.1 hypothetical protein A3194_19145 [Candidatus Thiodiazotropha endoloripes]
MKKYMPSQNTVFNISSGLVLLGVSTIFGFMSMPAEMGLSILAGALGMAFSNIDKLSEFSGAGFSAKMKDQLQAVIDKETETEISDEEDKTINNMEKSILKALSNPKYTWRTLPGVSKEASLSESETWTILVTLIQKGLVRTGTKNKTGEMIWSLTQIGRSHVG